MRNTVSASAIRRVAQRADREHKESASADQTLDAGQVGSIGIVFDPPKHEDPGGLFEAALPSVPKLRKGHGAAYTEQAHGREWHCLSRQRVES